MPIADELCVHVEMGAEIAGGFVFAAEQPPVNVGMCRDCLAWCCSNFTDPHPIEGDADANQNSK